MVKVSLTVHIFHALETVFAVVNSTSWAPNYHSICDSRVYNIYVENQFICIFYCTGVDNDTYRHFHCCLHSNKHKHCMHDSMPLVQAQPFGDYVPQVQVVDALLLMLYDASI